MRGIEQQQHRRTPCIHRLLIRRPSGQMWQRRESSLGFGPGQRIGQAPAQERFEMCDRH
jgi:hypothetical protein